MVALVKGHVCENVVWGWEEKSKKGAERAGMTTRIHRALSEFMKPPVDTILTMMVLVLQSPPVVIPSSLDIPMHRGLGHSPSTVHTENTSARSFPSFHMSEKTTNAKSGPFSKPQAGKRGTHLLRDWL